MAHRASLPGFTATGDVNLDVEAFQLFHQGQRLAYDHATGFTGEELVNRLAVDGDGTEPRFMKTRATALLRRPVP